MAFNYFLKKNIPKIKLNLAALYRADNVDQDKTMALKYDFFIKISL
jgi:hypothetical protein